MNHTSIILSKCPHTFFLHGIYCLIWGSPPSLHGIPTSLTQDPNYLIWDPNFPTRNPNLPTRDPSCPTRHPNCPARDPNCPTWDRICPAWDRNCLAQDPARDPDFFYMGIGDWNYFVNPSITKLCLTCVRSFLYMDVYVYTYICQVHGFN